MSDSDPRRSPDLGHFSDPDSDDFYSEEDGNLPKTKRYRKEDTLPLNCYLIGIELFNFKSYNGHHIIGPFTDLTAIIGSNGSGKSNLMDAVSFALCVKSQKLRAKNASLLISCLDSQSDAEENHLIKAYVKLIFKSRDDDSEMSMERRILRDNSFEYGLDNQDVCTYEQYMRFLTRLGLNARNKIFLLFQGTVDTVVTKNSMEFTKIIEELSGSSKFVKDYDKLKVFDNFPLCIFSDSLHYYSNLIICIHL